MSDQDNGTTDSGGDMGPGNEIINDVVEVMTGGLSNPGSNDDDSGDSDDAGDA